MRKIDNTVKFSDVYDEDSGRPAVDSVMLVKMVRLQHICGIKSLRKTVWVVDMNIAYRWFVGCDIDTPIPHFATISYAFATRFPSHVFEDIFAWILGAAVTKGFIKAETVFLEATHIKRAIKSWHIKWRVGMMNSSGRKAIMTVQRIAKSL